MSEGKSVKSDNKTRFDLGFSLILNITAIYLPVWKKLIDELNLIEELAGEECCRIWTPELMITWKKGMASPNLGFDRHCWFSAYRTFVGVNDTFTLPAWPCPNAFALKVEATGMIGDPSFKSSERNLWQKATFGSQCGLFPPSAAISQSFLDFSGATTKQGWIGK